MKKYSYILVMVAALFLASCAKDSLKAPEVKLSGQLLAPDGTPIGVRNAAIQVEGWQHGFQLFTKIPMPISQAGLYSQLLYAGKYKVIPAKGVGPWVDVVDSVDVDLNSEKTVNITVQPYFTLRNVTFVKNAGNSVSATFTLVNTTPTPGRTLERVRLFLGNFLILDHINNAANAESTTVPSGTPFTLTANIPAALQTQPYIYARVGVKTTGIAEYLYSTSERIQLK